MLRILFVCIQAHKSYLLEFIYVLLDEDFYSPDYQNQMALLESA